MSGIFDPGIFDSGIFDDPSGAASVTATDTVTTSDSAARTGTFNRTATDSLTTSDSATKAGSLVRAASDTRTTSDSATDIVVTARTATDSVSVTGTATKSKAVHRTAAQTTTLSDSASRLGSSFARSNSDAVTIFNASERVVGSSIYAVPGAPPSPPAGSPTQPPGPLSLDPVIRYGIVIKVDGVDITEDVVIAEAEFISMVNGQPGSCVIKVKDPNRDKSFTTGVRITLDISGNRVWAGYLANVKRVYAFGYHSPETRFLRLEGVDINVLFRKRFIEYLATPTRMQGPVYAAHTKDITAIGDLIDDWLDLSGDNLETGAYVENIGDVNIDQKANLWQAGWDWGSAMSTIARLTQAIYYITPNRHLVYTDVNTANAPFAMSDTPTSSQVSYRELELTHDGSGLINDALIWGIGGGSPDPVFQRLTSSGSVSTHGRWQYGQTYSGVYKQATLDRIADSLVNGSPLSKRGAKFDRVSVSLATYTPGFLPAQKIDFHSNVFGFTDVIPVRRMQVTFPAGNPRYQLTLSHEIDQPFNLIDIIPITPINLNFPPINFPPQVLPPFLPPGGNCGITDTFTRTVSSGTGGPGLGTSDSGLEWTTQDGFWEVDGSRAKVTSTDGNGTGAYLVPPVFSDVTVTGQLAASGSNRTISLAFDVEGSAGVLEVDFDSGGLAQLTDGWQSAYDSTTLPFGAGTATKIRLVLVGETANVYIWEASGTMPSTPTLTLTSEAGHPYTALKTLFIGCFEAGGGTGPFSAYFDDLDVAGINNCTVSGAVIDDFENRVLSGSMGTSSGGYTYSGVFVGSLDTLTIDDHILSLSTTFPTGNTQLDASLMTDTSASDDDYPPGLQYEGIFSFSFRTSAVRDSNRDKETFITIRNFVSQVATDNGEWSLFIYVSNYAASPSEHGAVWISGDSNPFAGTEYVKNDWLNNTWYRVEVGQFGSEVMVRVYEDGGVPPGWQARDSTAIPFPWLIDPAPDGFAELDFDIQGSDSSTVFSIITIDLDDIRGPEAPSAGAPGGGVSGTTTETPTRIDSTHYQLSSKVVQGSETVSINGIVQTANVDYTININTGVITFTSPVDIADVVSVHYIANGYINTAGSEWTQIFFDDFDVDVALGSFTTNSRYFVYPTSFHDTSGNGQYTPGILSVHDSVLDYYIHTVSGVHQVGGVIPKAGTLSSNGDFLYGRVELRVRADSMAGYKGVPLLWPVSGHGPGVGSPPYDGEIDWPESNFTATPHAFMHRQNGTASNDQVSFTPPGSPTWQDWHVYATEWKPGHCEFFIDGVSIGATTDRVPNTPMHWVLQFETQLSGGAPSDAVSGHVEIDYISVWQYTP